MKRQILIDVNLSKISFSEDGVLIALDFIDMYKGKPFANIICERMISFQIQNMFEPNAALPCYITEVTLLKIPNIEISTFLIQNGYIFGTDAFIDGPEELFLVSVIGGEAEISIICSNVKVIRKSETLKF